MIDIRKELIDEELQFDINKGFKFRYKKLSNRYIDWLFDHYYLEEFTEHFYDADYTNDRIRFNNWIELYSEGVWDKTQKEVNNLGRKILKTIRSFPTPIKGRLWIAENKNEIKIYFYGRDLWEIDYWFTFHIKHIQK